MLHALPAFGKALSAMLQTEHKAKARHVTQEALGGAVRNAMEAFDKTHVYCLPCVANTSDWKRAVDGELPS